MALMAIGPTLTVRRITGTRSVAILPQGRATPHWSMKALTPSTSVGPMRLWAPERGHASLHSPLACPVQAHWCSVLELWDAIPGVAVPREVLCYLGGLVKARAFPPELDFRIIVRVGAISSTITRSFSDAFCTNRLVVLLSVEVVPGMW